ncbi:MAG TPA: hypothetical protein VMG60_05645 [Burkholderiaceae bacterium]|nr:hypothetical protein [Burkholderiaceae bacterium]
MNAIIRGCLDASQSVVVFPEGIDLSIDLNRIVLIDPAANHVVP